MINSFETVLTNKIVSFSVTLKKKKKKSFCEPCGLEVEDSSFGVRPNWVFYGFAMVAKVFSQAGSRGFGSYIAVLAWCLWSTRN